MPVQEMSKLMLLSHIGVNSLAAQKALQTDNGGSDIFFRIRLWGAGNS